MAVSWTRPWAYRNRPSIWAAHSSPPYRKYSRVCSRFVPRAKRGEIYKKEEREREWLTHHIYYLLLHYSLHNFVTHYPLFVTTKKINKQQNQEMTSCVGGNVTSPIGRMHSRRNDWSYPRYYFYTLRVWRPPYHSGPLPAR